ncbi:MAG: hypothetical protein O7I93_00640 [Gemmatimonadetes bacterium]|nr:hypothetical protein [Gemmatimonadota bacterium]
MRIAQPKVLIAALSASIVLAGCGTAHGRRGIYMDFIRPDQRPPLIGTMAIADSLWGPADESARGDGIAESRRGELQRLVERFVPTLVMPNNDYAAVDGRRYQLLPTDMRLFTDTLRLDLMQAAPYMFQDSINIAIGSLSHDSLVTLTQNALLYESDPNLVAAWYFDWPGENPREWWEAYGRYRTGPDSTRWAQPTVYAHPFLAPDGRIVIQYWYLYPFNDFIGNHEGDWEHINVVLAPDWTTMEEVHYYFHARSIKLPQGGFEPEVVDGTHPVIYVGGRAYNIFDYPVRIFAGEKNEGSHGSYPYAGEWEAAAGLGSTESVRPPDKDSTRVVSHDRFRVVLTPEPNRIDYLSRPEILEEWMPFLLPVRWGFPSAPSLGDVIRADVGNRAPFGPSYNAAWNRTAPGMQYMAYQIKKIPKVRSFVEDLLQPWYYLYIFRTPRYVHDTRDGRERERLVRLGLAPAGGGAERGFGTTILGLQFAYPQQRFGDVYGTSNGFLVWRNLWVKMRFGALEFLGGYQKFPRSDGLGGSLFVYPFTANLVLRAPDALFRPYASLGGGAYGWEARVKVDPATSMFDTGGSPVDPQQAQLVWSGWDVGLTASVGVEYYLRPRVALDVGLRYHATGGPGTEVGIDDGNLRFLTLWVGHYVRF